MKLVVTLCFWIFSFSLFSQNFQDSIILLNGKSFIGQFEKTNDEFLFFNLKGKNGNDLIMLEKYRVFSYTVDNAETVVYKYDSLSDNFLTVNQSRKFALGSYDARQMYSSKPAFYTSIGLSYGLSLFDTYLTKKAAKEHIIPNLKTGFFSRKPSILPLTMMLVMPISFGLPSTKVKSKHILQKGLRNDQYYYEGFNNVARQKRSMSALKGSLIGIGLGYLSYGVFKTN